MTPDIPQNKIWIKIGVASDFTQVLFVHLTATLVPWESFPGLVVDICPRRGAITDNTRAPVKAGFQNMRAVGDAIQQRFTQPSIRKQASKKSKDVRIFSMNC